MGHPQPKINPDEQITDEEYEALVQEGDRLFELATQAWLRYFEEHPEDRDLDIVGIIRDDRDYRHQDDEGQA